MWSSFSKRWPQSKPACLAPLLTESDAIKPLTPVGRAIESLPDPSESFHPLSLLYQWHLCQNLARHFWFAGPRSISSVLGGSLSGSICHGTCLLVILSFCKKSTLDSDNMSFKPSGFFSSGIKLCHNIIILEQPVSNSISETSLPLMQVTAPLRPASQMDSALLCGYPSWSTLCPCNSSRVKAIRTTSIIHRQMV